MDQTAQLPSLVSETLEPGFRPVWRICDALHIMRDDFVRDRDFIEFVFEDGTKGAVRKGEVIGFTESTVEV